MLRKTSARNNDVQAVSISTVSNNAMQAISISTASSMDVQGVNLSAVSSIVSISTARDMTCRVYHFSLQAVWIYSVY